MHLSRSLGVSGQRTFLETFQEHEMLLIESKYVDFAMVFRKVVFGNLKSHLFSFVQKFVSVWTPGITFVWTRSSGSRCGSILVRMATHSQVDGSFVERFIHNFIENVLAQRSRGSRGVKVAVHLSSAIVFFPHSHHPTEQCHPSLLNY